MPKIPITCRVTSPAVEPVHGQPFTASSASPTDIDRLASAAPPGSNAVIVGASTDAGLLTALALCAQKPNSTPMPTAPATAAGSSGRAGPAIFASGTVSYCGCSLAKSSNPACRVRVTTRFVGAPSSPEEFDRVKKSSGRQERIICEAAEQHKPAMPDVSTSPLPVCLPPTPSTLPEVLLSTSHLSLGTYLCVAQQSRKAYRRHLT